MVTCLVGLDVVPKLPIQHSTNTFCGPTLGFIGKGEVECLTFIFLLSSVGKRMIFETNQVSNGYC